MSTVDKRVVQMQFDNAQFERGVSQSMKSIDELNEKLEFKGSEKGANRLKDALSVVADSTETQLLKSTKHIENAFTTIGGIVKTTIKRDIVDATINAVKRLEQATLGQIRTGGWSRAMNLANARFMVEGLKLDWDEMLKAINYGVQDTAYGLDAAAKAASSLAASGVDFRESVDGANDSLMHTSLRAISGVAAMTNSTYEDISRIFTSVAGNGRLMGDQLLQLSARGLNVAANLAQVMNTTEADIRDMVSRGKIDFQTFAEAMDDAFGAHAKEANKTFTGSLSNMKAALSRIGAIFATPVIAKTNEVFIALTGKIKEVQKALNDLTVNGETVVRFAGHFAEAWERGVEVVSKFIRSIDMSWFQNVADAMDTISQKVKGVFDDLDYYFSDYTKETKENANTAVNALELTEKEYQAVLDVIGRKYGDGATRIKELSDAGFDENARKRIQRWVDAIVKAKYSIKDAEINGKKFEKTIESTSGTMSDMVRQSKELTEQERIQKKVDIRTIFNKLAATMATVKRVAGNLIAVIKNLTTAAFRGFFKALDPKRGASNLKTFTYSLEHLSEKLVELSEKVAPYIEAAFEKIAKVVGGALSVITKAASSVINFIAGYKETKEEVEDTNKELSTAKRVWNSLIEILKKGWEKLKKLPDFFEELWDAIKKDERVKKLQTTLKGLWSTMKKTADDAVKPAVEALESFTNGSGQETSDTVTAIANGIGEMAENLDWFINKIPEWADAVEKFFDGVEKKVIGWYETIKKKIVDKLGGEEAFSTLEESASNAISKVAGFFGKSEVEEAVNEASGTMSDLVANQKKVQENGKSLIDMITEKLDSIDWDNVLSISGMTLFMAGIFKLTQLTESAIGLLDAVKEIPEALTGVLEAFKALGEALTISIMNVTKAIEVGIITASIIAIGLLVVALGNMDRDKLEQGMAAMVLIGVFFKIVVIGFVNAINNMKSLTIAARQGTTFANKLKAQLVAILNSFVRAISIGILIAALAGSVLMIVKAMDTFAKIDPNRASEALGVVTIIFIAVLAIGALLYKAFMKETATDYDMKTVKAMFSLAAVMAAMGIAVYLIAKACATLKNANVGWTEVGMVGLLVLVTTAMAAVMIKSTSSVQPGKVLKVALSVFILTLALGLIVAELIGLAIVMSLAKALGIENEFRIGAAIIVGIILALGLAVELMANAANKFKSIRKLPAIILSFAVVILALAAAVSIMSGAEHMVGASIAIGVMLIVIAGVMVGMVALLKKITGGGGEDASKILNSLAVGFIAIAAAMLLLAAAASVLSGVSWADLGKLGVVFAVFVGVFALMAAFIAPEKLKAIAVVIISLGASMTLFGVGVLLLAAGIKLLQALFPQLIIDLGLIAKTIAEHPAIFAAIVLVIVAITVAIVKLATVLAPVFSVIGDALKNAGNALLTFFKNIAHKAGDWFKSLSASSMVMLVGLIAGLCMALVKSGPMVLETIGKVIFMVLDFLAGIVGKLAVSIVALIVKLIYGITDAITANSATIANALMSLCIALLDILWQVLGQLLSWMFGDEIGGKIADAFDRVSVKTFERLQESRARAMEADNLKKARLGLIDDPDYEEKTARFVENVPEAGGGSHWGTDVSNQYDQVAGSISNVGDSADKASGSLKMFNSEASNGSHWGGLTGGSGSNWLDGMADGFANVSGAANKATDSLNGHTAAMSDVSEATGRSINDLAHYVLVLSDASAVQQDAMIKAGVAYRDANGMFYEIVDKQKKEAANGFGLDMSGFSDFMGDSGVAGGTALTDGILSGADSGSIDIQDWMSQNGLGAGETFDASAVEGLESGQVDLYNAQSDNVDALNKANVDGRDDVRKSVKENVNDVGVAMVNSARDRYYEAGDYSISGVVAAIRAGKDEVYNASAELAQAGIDGYNSKKGQDSNSPSKKYYQNGLYSILGIVNAINQNEGMATDAMTSLASSMVNSFGSGLAYVGKVASGELQYDPTIRPILDTSRVGMGAASINGMFNKQTVSLSGFSGRLAADIGELDSRNSDVVTELQMLRDEMAYMTEEMTNMQMVVDSGALVGAIAPGMDRSLGRMAKFKGRGN